MGSVGWASTGGVTASAKSKYPNMSHAVCIWLLGALLSPECTSQQWHMCWRGTQHSINSIIFLSSKMLMGEVWTYKLFITPIIMLFLQTTLWLHIASIVNMTLQPTSQITHNRTDQNVVIHARMNCIFFLFFLCVKYIFEWQWFWIP